MRIKNRKKIIYKRQDSSYWWYSFTVEGRQFRGSTKTSDREIALQFVENLKQKIYNKEHLDKKDNILLDDAFVRYIKEEAQYKKSPRIIYANIKRFSSFFKGDSMYIHRIKDPDINDYIQWRKTNIVPNTTRRVSDETIRKELCTLRRVLKLVNRWGHNGTVIDFEMHLEELGRARVLDNYITEDKQIELLKNLNDYLKVPYYFAIVTGLRWGNVRSFRADQIDWGKNKIQFSVKTPKRDDKIIKIDLTPLLESLLLYVGIERGKDNKNRYVFLYTKRNGQVSPLGDHRKNFASACKASGIELIRGQKFHILRHTAATNIIASSGNPKFVQDILKHNNIQTSMNYVHLLKKDIAETMDKSAVHLVRNWYDMNNKEKS